jgi:hypothetical protein
LNLGTVRFCCETKKETRTKSISRASETARNLFATTTTKIEALLRGRTMTNIVDHPLRLRREAQAKDSLYRAIVDAGLEPTMVKLPEDRWLALSSVALSRELMSPNTGIDVILLSLKATKDGGLAA